MNRKMSTLLLLIMSAILKYLSATEEFKMTVEIPANDNDGDYYIANNFPHYNNTPCKIGRELVCDPARNNRCGYETIDTPPVYAPIVGFVRFINLANLRMNFERRIGEDSLEQTNNFQDTHFWPYVQCTGHGIRFGDGLSCFSVFPLTEASDDGNGESVYTLAENSVLDLEKMLGTNYGERIVPYLNESNWECFKKTLLVAKEKGKAVYWPLKMAIFQNPASNQLTTDVTGRYEETRSGDGISLTLKEESGPLFFKKDGENECGQVIITEVLPDSPGEAAQVSQPSKDNKNRRMALIVSISVGCAIFLIVCLIVAIYLSRDAKQEMGGLQMENSDVNSGHMGQVRIPYAFAVEEEA